MGKVVVISEDPRIYPIQLLTPLFGQRVGSGFAAIFQTEQSCESVHIWAGICSGAYYDGIRDNMNKLEFVSEGENRVEGKLTTYRKSGLFGEQTWTEFVIDKIILRKGTVIADTIAKGQIAA